MSLGEHLRELRNRVLKSVIAVLVFGIIGIVFFESIFDFLVDGFQDACGRAATTGAAVADCQITYTGVIDPFTVQLQIGLITGIILGCPVWIYQAWQFVTPGLYRNEKRWGTLAVGVAVPLFLTGVALCYWVLPRALSLLIGFIPEGVGYLVTFKGYLSVLIRLVLAFGLAFLLPIFVVLLNAVGILSGETLVHARRWIIVGIIVFAAVATPTGDPITLLTLAVPMWVLFEASVLVCRFNDRRRAMAAAAVSDDEASALEEVPRDPADERPSNLDDDDAT